MFLDGYIAVVCYKQRYVSAPLRCSLSTVKYLSILQIAARSSVQGPTRGSCLRDGFAISYYSYQ